MDLGDPRGSGFWNERYMGKGREMGRSVYEQPGNEVDRILKQQGGFQVSKGNERGAKRNRKGKAESRKQRDCSTIALFNLHSCT